jgi:hypothetical protein
MASEEGIDGLAVLVLDGFDQTQVAGCQDLRREQEKSTD